MAGKTKAKTVQADDPVWWSWEMVEDLIMDRVAWEILHWVKSNPGSNISKMIESSDSTIPANRAYNKTKEMERAGLLIGEPGADWRKNRTLHITPRGETIHGVMMLALVEVRAMLDIREPLVRWR